MTLETRLNNGKTENRVDIIFMGDGYTAGETDLFATHADNLTDYLFTSGGQLADPFSRYQNFFNVHLIYTESNESGTDDPASNQTADTAFDSTFLFDGVTDRLLSVNNAKTTAVMDAELAGTGIEADMRFVSVNTTKYGGAGGKFATYAGGNSDALELALHEVAHSFAGLADEYSGFTSGYTGGEPSEANVTTDPSGAKWDHWKGYNQPGIGVIDAYEGGRYYDRGIYRPSDNSKMKNLGQPFDVVSIEQFVLTFYQFVDPLDEWSNSGGGLITGAHFLTVTPVDVDVIDIEWRVNDILLGVGDVTELDLHAIGYRPGKTVTVQARAYDNGDLVRINLDELEMTVSWSVKIPFFYLNLAGSKLADKIVGTNWAEQLLGKAGDDVLKGKGGKDKILGGDGDDRLIGDKGKDILKGGDGDDVLKGGKQDDKLTGNAGADIFEFSKKQASGVDTVFDFEDGIDTLKFTGGMRMRDLDITSQGGDTHITWAKGEIVLRGIASEDISRADFDFA